MFKKGQVTVFIIIGICILALFGGIYFLTDLFSHDIDSSVDVESFNNIQLFIDSCLATSAENGVREVLAQGGYDDVLEAGSVLQFPKEGDDFLVLPAYFDAGFVRVPTLSEIQHNAEERVTHNFLRCVNSFETLKMQGYTIEASEPIIALHFEPSTTTVLLRYVLVVTLGSSTKELNNFEYTMSFAFPQTYNAVRQFLVNQSMVPSEFLVTGLSDAVLNTSGSFGFSQTGDQGRDVLVQFRTAVDNPIVYQFGLTYDFDEDELVEEKIKPILSDNSGLIDRSVIEMDFLPEWNISKNGVFHYTPTVRGEGLSYSLDTKAIEIDAVTGEMTAYSSKLPNDEYEFILTVEDKFHSIASQPLYLNVRVVNETVPAIVPISRQIVERGTRLQVPVVLHRQVADIFEEAVYSVDAPPIFVIDSATGVLTARAIGEDAGNYSVRVNAYTSSWNTWYRFEVEFK